jgi:AcrR family transcriptional regulator
MTVRTGGAPTGSATPVPARATRKPAAVRRQEILDAATLEFAETGLAGTRLEVIAARASISHPRVVQMFGSKQALFLNVVDQAFDQIEEAFRTSSVGKPPTLVELGDAYRRLLRRERSVGLVMLQAYAAASDDEIRTLVRQRHLGVERLVAKLTGGDANQVRAFVASGLVLTVSTVLQLPAQRKDAAWGAWLLEQVVDR